MGDVVVVGIDGSDAGTRAARFAAKEASGTGDDLVVCYVVPWSPYTVQSAEENERRHAAKEREAETGRAEVVEPVVELLRQQDVKAEGLVRHGHPAETLCDVAAEKGATHIVVGRRGQSRVRSLLFGSTAGNLIQIATVPVTVVP